MGVRRLSPRAKRVTGYLLALLTVCCGILIFRGMHQAQSADISPLETRVLGQSRWLRGGPAALRVIITDHRTGAPVRAKVRIALYRLENSKPEKKGVDLFTGNTDAAGTLSASFTVPSVEPGPYELHVVAATILGVDEVTQQIQVEESAQLLLTCDKPLYQPGQTMHLRVLAFDLATRTAIMGQPITFEVEDARGNKVFKQRQRLSEFGIAAVDFTLADEVNMGTFTLRAIIPQGEVEKKVRVERYVLPKFKVALTTRKSYYLPGETVRGTVQADYFFGKPVANSQVTVAISTMDIGVSQLAELKGETDENGTFDFEYRLPNSFVGQPFEQGKAVVEFHGIVLDTAEHQQETFVTVPVVKDPILLAVVPESRTLVAGIANRVFIAAATPDGKPLADADIVVRTNDDGVKREAATQKTDALGLITYEFTPTDKSVTLTVEARTDDGRDATVKRTLDGSPAKEGILLRANKSMARVGDRVNIGVISTLKTGTIYLDVIRNQQTILTKSLTSNNGQAGLTLPITNDMVGTLEIHAYKILPNEDIMRDTQLLIVTPANDLVVKVDTDKKTYRPGDDARVTLSVQDQQAHPVMAALGMAIVDESVYALSELQPGLEKIFFTLEKELMEPKYEIHGLKPVDLVLDPDAPRPMPLRDGDRQLAAEMLLAAVPMDTDFSFRANTYQQRWEKVKPEVEEEMSKDLEVINKALQKYREEQKRSLTAVESLFRLVDTGYLKLDDLKDRWGHFYRTDLHGAQNYDGWFTLNSAGPDGRWGTVDDVKDIGQYGIIHRFQKGAMRGRFDDDVMVMDAAVPMPQQMRFMNMAVMPEATGTGGAAPTGAAEPVRIREFFPETMYWNPSIITDAHGRATVTVPVADSITSWRMSLLANTAIGQLGSTTASMRVFQDFFIDLDLPVSLTQHDNVSIPVAVYNYLPGSQDVQLRLEVEPWFALQGPAEQVVHLEKDEVKVVYFPITVNDLGHHTLTVFADGTEMSDAIRRTIDVQPDGKEVREAINDRLEGKIEKTVTIPAEAIDDASAVWVKLYPGSFSQVVEGLDGILRMPNGCFEQTSSTTYPNILVLDYLKAQKRINPELQMKAEQYINVGYQRLVTFECKHGGFSWFGDEPAHQILTAYGLLEFTDMAKVHEVDPVLISRTQRWLADRQQGDGSWPTQEGGIAEGIINRQTGALRGTAYIAWALAESDYRGPQVDHAVQYVKAHRDEAKDPYTLAVLLNLLAKVDRNGDATSDVAKALIAQAKVTDKTAYWESDTKTFTGATKEGADLETTGLAAYGLVKWGSNSGFTNKVLTHLVQSKDSFGTWSSTQGTVWSLKALLLASSAGTGGGTGKATVLVNGEQAATFNITAEDSDVMRQVDLTGKVHEGKNQISLQFTGDGAPLYQIVTRYYLPWNLVEQRAAEKGPMSIDVRYDKRALAQNDTATVTATVKNETRAIVEMPLIDLGLPPGFTVDTEMLDDAVQAKRISKYTVAARQVIIYLEKLDPGQSIQLSYRVKAKYPIRARTPQSVAYPYYNPEQATISAPQEVTVRK